MFGYLGVELFFVISGFVVLWSATGRTTGAFARARVVRLYPEYWLSVPFTTVVFLLTGTLESRVSLRDFALNMTMLPQYLGAPFIDGVYWTLGVEVKFYVLLGALIALRQIGNIERWLLGCLLLMCISVIYPLHPAVDAVLIAPYGSLFAGGGLLYLVFDRGWTVPRALGVFVAGSLSVHHALEGIPGFIQSVDISDSVRVVVACVIVAIFVAFSLVSTWGSGLRFGSWTATLGSLTYPLYLLHNTGKSLFIRNFESSPLFPRVLAAIVFSLFASLLVHLVASKYLAPLLRRALSPAR
jgi:peptidoglycan/LPS O-acetylase OafA/YrhL